MYSLVLFHGLYIMEYYGRSEHQDGYWYRTTYGENGGGYKSINSVPFLSISPTIIAMFLKNSLRNQCTLCTFYTSRVCSYSLSLPLTHSCAHIYVISHSSFHFISISLLHSPKRQSWKLLSPKERLEICLNFVRAFADVSQSERSYNDSSYLNFYASYLYDA